MIRSMVLCALLVCLGCENDAPPPPRGVARSEPAAPAAATPKKEEPRNKRRSQPTFTDDTAPEPAFIPEEGPRAAPQEEKVAEVETKEERDLGEELRLALGMPASCFDASMNLPDVLNFSVSAYVTVTGRVTRADVSGADLNDKAASCIARRVEALRFRSPVEGAPKKVSKAFRFTTSPQRQAG